MSQHTTELVYLIYLWLAEMYSGICLGNHPAVLLLLQDLFALRGTRRLTTNTRR